MNTMTKSQVVKAMAQHGIQGQVRGAGRDWEVELPSEEEKADFQANVAEVGGFKTGYGSWILRPGYQCQGDWNDRSSRCHY